MPSWRSSQHAPARSIRSEHEKGRLAGETRRPCSSARAGRGNLAQPTAWGLLIEWGELGQSVSDRIGPNWLGGLVPSRRNLAHFRQGAGVRRGLTIRLRRILQGYPCVLVWPDPAIEVSLLPRSHRWLVAGTCELRRCVCVGPCAQLSAPTQRARHLTTAPPAPFPANQDRDKMRQRVSASSREGRP